MNVCQFHDRKRGIGPLTVIMTADKRPFFCRDLFFRRRNRYGKDRNAGIGAPHQGNLASLTVGRSRNPRSGYDSTQGPVGPAPPKMNSTKTVPSRRVYRDLQERFDAGPWWVWNQNQNSPHLIPSSFSSAWWKHGKSGDCAGDGGEDLCGHADGGNV